MKALSFAFWANIAAVAANVLVVAYVPGEHSANLVCIGLNAGIALVVAVIRD